MGDGQIHMTSVQYREAMGLDPTTPKADVKVTVKHKDETAPMGDSFIRGVRRFALRLFWLAGWAWMLFTFGWVGHVIVQITERMLNEGT